MSPSPPSLDTLDAELTALRDQTGKIAVALMALDGDTTRTLLERARGRTAARWRQPAVDLAASWVAYPQLSAAVDALTALRGGDRRPSRDTAARLDTGLHAGIDLAAGGADPGTCGRIGEAAAGRTGGRPGAPIGPLSPARLAATLGDLLSGVSAALAEVRTAQASLLPRAEASVRALDDLRVAVDGIEANPEGRRAAAELDALTDALSADPLGLSPAAFDAVDDAIAAAHAAATSAAALRAHLSELLAAGRAALAALPGLLEQARAAHRLAAAKIAGVPAEAAPPGTAAMLPDEPQLRALAAELAALDALAAAGQWRALAARRPRWSARVAAATDLVTAAREHHRGLLARRDELRGRLGGYQAKARARGLAEDEQLSRMADRAHDTLYRAPCDLTLAGQQVDSYVAAVRAATSPTPPTGSPLPAAVRDGWDEAAGGRPDPAGPPRDGASR